MKNSFQLYGGRGKIGNIVVYTSNGKSISRERNFAPKNPRTAKQAVQRMVAAAVTSYARELAYVLNNAFDGYTNGAGDMARFRSLAMKRARVLAVTGINTDNPAPALFLPKGATGIQPLDGIVISEGSIASSRMSYDQNSKNFSVTFLDGIVDLDGTNPTFNNENRDLTPAKIAGAFGCIPGDQLTFVELYFTENTPNNVDDPYFVGYTRVAASISRLRIKDTAGIQALIDEGRPGDRIPVSEVFDDSIDPGSIYTITGSVGPGQGSVVAKLTIGTVPGSNSIQGGVIRTTIQGGVQKHSFTQLLSNTGEFDVNTAAQAYGSYQGNVSQPDVESPYYTEQAV